VPALGDANSFARRPLAPAAAFALALVTWVIVVVLALLQPQDSRQYGLFASSLIYVFVVRQWFRWCRSILDSRESTDIVAFFGVPLFLLAVPVLLILLGTSMDIASELRVQLVGDQSASERFVGDFGPANSEVSTFVYADWRGDSIPSRDRFQFRMSPDKARPLLREAGFQAGAGWAPDYYASDSPEEFPVLWYPLWTSERLESFTRDEGYDRAWLDSYWGVVYLDLRARF